MYIAQRSLLQPVSFSGKGIHRGTQTTVTIRPAPVNTGIRFHRIDTDPITEIPATVEFAHKSPLCTGLQRDGYEIKTIEHLCSALAGLQVTNALIQVSGEEIPILDGSAIKFAQAIKEAGIVHQSQAARHLRILQPIHVQIKNAWTTLSPCSKGLEMKMTLDYQHPAIAPRYASYSLTVTPFTFFKELAPARTFGFLTEVEELQRRGLGLGGSLDCAVVLTQEGVLNSEGLRFPNEPIRHKLLDALGDLSLCGYPIWGRFEGFCSGHSLNALLVESLLSQPQAWTLTTQAGFENHEEPSSAPRSLAKEAL